MFAPTSVNSPRSGRISGNADDVADGDGLTDFDGAVEILRSWGAGLTPDPDLTVSQWADRHRWLSSRASAEPGRYRTARTPYMRAIMDDLSPASPVQRVVFMKAAQVGATEAGNCFIGFVMHHAPGPMLAVQPTVELAKRNSRQRIDPLIEESPELRDLLDPEDPALKEARRHALTSLRTLSAQPADGRAARVQAIRNWSLAHGLAMLLRHGRIVTVLGSEEDGLQTVEDFLALARDDGFA
jgi:hypothetical protein